jgi:hypothetical protein
MTKSKSPAPTSDFLRSGPADVAANPITPRSMTNSDHRQGESPGRHSRSERAIQIGDEWFISTREGIKIGPYATREEADVAAAELATMLIWVTDPEISRQFVIREFMLTRWTRVRARLHRK